MTYVADLHLHSSYAYATSNALTLENLAEWAKLKGIDLLASADFTHPMWFGELTEKLSPSSPGLYQFNGVQFILGTEVSCVYQQGGRQRRVHILLFAPNLEAVEQLNQSLSSYGNLGTDGRPTLSLSVRDLTELVLDTDPESIVIPAHAWTPWYGVFGSKSGFDSLEECFEDMVPAINAIETGLSSDPGMNWTVQELVDKTIVSFSDAHSLPKLAREVTTFEGELSYPGFARALLENQVAYTVEFYPEEGKYHYDGHRKCGICQSPQETFQNGERCPACGRPMTLGVLHRTALLGGDTVEHTPDSGGFIHSSQGRPPYIRLIPLQEIIAEVFEQSPNTRRVQAEYRRLVQELGNELRVLISAEQSELESVAGERLAQAILMNRMGKVHVEPGYDGVFGKISLPIAEEGHSEESHPPEENALQPRLLEL
jgi:uncharacterized protein (TIGR00375 family)